MFTWELFRHYLLSRRAGALIRTVAWLCMAGVTIGVMSLVVVISVMNGFNDQMRKRLLAVEPHLVVQVDDLKSSQALETIPLYTFLTSKPGVKTEIFETQDVILRTVDGLFGGAVAKGVSSASMYQLLKETRPVITRSTDGYETPPLLEESAALHAGEVFIGIDLARSLGIFEGDKITVIPPEALLLPAGEAPPFERVLVKGLVTTNIPDIDSKVIFYGRGVTFQGFRGPASLSVGYEIRLPDPYRYEKLRAELLKQAGSQMHVATWIERNSSLFYALRMEKMAMSTFLGLAALIASFSIVTVLVLLLTQKRKDIGVLMSMGLSPHRARWLFVRLGLLLSSVGIGLGIGLGILICWIVNRYPLSILPDIYYDTTIPAKVEPSFIFGILIVAGAIAFISAYLPAKANTDVLPAESLRSSRQR